MFRADYEPVRVESRIEARTGKGVSKSSDRSGWKDDHWTVKDTVVIVAEMAPEVPGTVMV